MKSKYDWNGFDGSQRIDYETETENVYNELIEKYPNVNAEVGGSMFCHEEFINDVGPFKDLYCYSTFSFIKFSEFSFYKRDIKTVKMCQELLNSFDRDNVIIACNILIKLKPMGNNGK